MYSSNLKSIIDKIYAEYHHPKYLGLDPLVCVRRFKRCDDLEVVGLLASALAYGRVEIIVRSIDTVIGALDCNHMESVGYEKINPTDWIGNTSYLEKLASLKNFKHRFNDGADIAALLESANTIMKEYGSLEKCFRECMDRCEDQFKQALTLFVNIIKDNGRKHCGVRRSFEYLVPSPSGGSACKRMLMFLRWMIRKNDGIDLGVWKSIPTSCLLIPVDTHVAQIARSYNLTKRNSADWKMSEEITSALRVFDADDPVKYDFALCHAGMADHRGM